MEPNHGADPWTSPLPRGRSAAELIRLGSGSECRSHHAWDMSPGRAPALPRYWLVSTELHGDLDCIRIRPFCWTTHHWSERRILKSRPRGPKPRALPLRHSLLVGISSAALLAPQYQCGGLLLTYTPLLVASDGIAPPTRSFSGCRSTTELRGHGRDGRNRTHR